MTFKGPPRPKFFGDSVKTNGQEYRKSCSSLEYLGEKAHFSSNAVGRPALSFFSHRKREIRGGKQSKAFNSHNFHETFGISVFSPRFRRDF